ncbi:DUF397 domain-containing protein [Glycomyces tritici]|uniref:DUF397 domain-containing protein n=1 Tax=Glycomyces tritici TaxID=2665176 RepID=A0ABT7YWJ0_9ACTN|nr:DUF397 domain-containing protein [Glycomyces tritici]MDN3243011.1 DUF397 domain-containing protein [Glycomyces tritici]
MTYVKDFGDQWTWRKSSRSGDNGGQCVFVAELEETTLGIRDSKMGQEGPILRLNRSDWASLARSVSR